MFGDIEVYDLSSVVTQHDQGVEKPKRRGCDNEHVNRRNGGQVVVQEAAPGRGGGFGPPRQVSSDRGLADRDAELEQFAVEPELLHRRLDLGVRTQRRRPSPVAAVRHRRHIWGMPTRRPAETTPDLFSAPPKATTAGPAAVSKGTAEPDNLASQPRHFLP